MSFNGKPFNRKISVRVFLQYRYYIVSCLLILFYINSTFRGNWANDFWEHTAVVRAFQNNLFNPSNPLVRDNIPHAFFSPYLFLVAIVGKTLNLDAINSLAVFGIINLVLLLISIPLFIREFSNTIDYKITSFYFLLLILFLWGSNPAIWSGFYHFFVLDLVLPYPSTIAGIISLYSLVWFNKLYKKPSWKYFIYILLSAGFVVLGHSLTFIFLVLGYFSIFLINLNHLTLTKLIKLVLLFLGITIICVFWPFFSVFQISKADSNLFNLQSQGLYSEWVIRILPCVPGFLIIIYEIIKKRYREVHLLTFLILIVYLYGDCSKTYSLGRLISFLAIMLQFFLAEFLVNTETRLSEFKLNRYYVIIILLISLLTYSINRGLFVQTWHRINFHRGQPAYAYLNKLKEYINDDDLVLASPAMSLEIPAFAGKVIVTSHPIHWLKDYSERVKNVNEFINTGSNTVRDSIYNLYSPNVIVIDRSNYCQPSLIEYLNIHYNKKYEGINFQIFRIKSNKDQ